MHPGNLRQLEPFLEPFDRLEQGLWEGAPQPQRLTDRLHLGAELAVRPGELLEIEAGALDSHVVERRLEGSARLSGDVVGQLVERVADREQRGELGDRKARRLRGERRGARDARVHLDDDDLLALGLVGELHVRAARCDTDCARGAEGRIAHALVGGVVERLLWRDRPRVAGVNTHRVEVLDRADDHAVARGVRHDLELELLPAPHRLLDEHLVDRACLEPVANLREQLVPALGEPAALAAQREGRTNDGRAGRVLWEIVDRVDDHATGYAQTGLAHDVAEHEPVLGPSNSVDVGADQLDAVLGEHALFSQLDREVESGLAAESGKQRVGALAGDHLRDRLRIERLDVGRVCPLGVGHDRRRVRVDERDADTL